MKNDSLFSFWKKIKLIKKQKKENQSESHQIEIYLYIIYYLSLFIILIIGSKGEEKCIKLKLSSLFLIKHIFCEQKHVCLYPQLLNLLSGSLTTAKSQKIKYCNSNAVKALQTHS